LLYGILFTIAFRQLITLFQKNEINLKGRLNRALHGMDKVMKDNQLKPVCFQYPQKIIA
jgi:hypothetical protein